MPDANRDRNSRRADRPADVGHRGEYRGRYTYDDFGPVRDPVMWMHRRKPRWQVAVAGHGQ